MAKYSQEFKLECVQEVVVYKRTKNRTAAKYNISRITLNKWIDLYSTKVTKNGAVINGEELYREMQNLKNEIKYLKEKILNGEQKDSKQ